MTSTSYAPRNGNPSVVVIGLDGATFDYIQPLMEAGRLPNLASVIDGGARAIMRSTYPPVSAPAWVTFMTGENPGRHGVYEFWSTDLSRYNPLAGERLVSSTTYAGGTIFDIVGRWGKVAALRVPATFPPWRVQGTMVSGYPSPFRGRGTVWPPSKTQLVGRRRSGKKGLLTRYRGSQEKMRLDMWREELELVTDLALKVLDEGNHALFMVVFNHLDGVCHHFVRHTDPAYPSYDPKRSPRYAHVIGESHEQIDGAVGDILKRVDDETLVIVMSDHGLGPRAIRYFHANAWLAQLGLLQPRQRVSGERLSRLLNFLNDNLPIRQELRRWVPRWLKVRVTGEMLNIGAVAWDRTKAYRVRMLAPVEGIEVNLRGRQPCGIVEPGDEYEALRGHILEQLRSLADPATGEPLVVRAFRREELYQGPHVERAPDIVYELNAKYETGVGVHPPLVSPIPRSLLTMRNGNHTMTGIFVARGPFVRSGVQLPEVHLADVAPTILYYLGLPVPENMDGRVLTEIFEPEFAAAHGIERGPLVAAHGTRAGGLSRKEEEAMRRQLRGLGYL